jgi:hypothetical protein
VIETREDYLLAKNPKPLGISKSLSEQVGKIYDLIKKKQFEINKKIRKNPHDRFYS